MVCHWIDGVAGVGERGAARLRDLGCTPDSADVMRKLGRVCDDFATAR